jgi:hypothetical protein
MRTSSITAFPLSLPYRRIRRIKMVHRTFQNGVQGFPKLAQDFLKFAQDFPNFVAHLGAVVQHPPVVGRGQHSGVNPLHAHSARTVSVDHLDKEVVNLANCFEALVDIHGWRRSGAGRPPNHAPGDQGQGRSCRALQVSFAISQTFCHSKR